MTHLNVIMALLCDTNLRILTKNKRKKHFDMSFLFKWEICQHKTENCAHQVNFMGSLKIRMRAPIGFSWQGLVWPGNCSLRGKMTVSFPLSSYREGEQKKHTQARAHAGTSTQNRTERKMHRARESWREREGEDERWDAG